MQFPPNNFSAEKANNIASLFFESAEKYPKNIAIIEGNKIISYTELLENVKQTAAHFKQKNIQKGDRVLVFVPMSINLYRIVLALFSVGATAVFLDEWVNLKRLEICCKTADCKAFIGSWKLHVLALFSTELRKIPIHLNLNFKRNAETRIVPVNANETALITFTTGSTGIPKAAKRTHFFLFEQFKALTKVIQTAPTDVDMPVLPIVLLLNLGVGASSVIAKFKSSKPKAFSGKTIYTQIKNHHITRITASPYFISKLSEFLIANNLENSTIKKIFTGGAPVFPNQALSYIKAFSSAGIYIVYGSTEAEPISVISAQELCEKPIQDLLPVGEINADINVKIIPVTNANLKFNDKKDFDDFCLSENEIGEIIVNGAHVLKEYWNNDEAFAKNKIVVGDEIWHRTGDAGSISNNRNLYLAGRSKQAFLLDENWIYPFLFEGFCNSLPGVVLGTLMLKENQVCAVLELDKKADKAAIENQIFKSKFPVNQIIFLKQIPRDPRHFSKIDYEKLEKKL